MGARGATSSSEAADVVLIVDRLDRLVDAIQIARRSRFNGLQSILLGMGRSLVAMAFAVAGFLPLEAGRRSPHARCGRPRRSAPVLYALHAVLRLNIAQEEELYVILTNDA